MAYTDNDDYMNGGTTLPDYQNFRNVLFEQWEILHNNYVEYERSPKSLRKAFKNAFIKSYKKFYGQINDKSKLSHLTKAQRKTLRYCYDNPNIISIVIAKEISDITRTLMQEYGVFNLESNDYDEAW